MELLIPLDSRHRAAITAHLLALSAEDRADRFTGTVSDEVVQDYVGAIGYARDVLVGALQERRLVGLAHAAVYTAGIPMLRTLSFAGGWVAQVILVLAIFGMM